MHDILLLLPMIALLFKKQIVERFENETCDATERKIELLEEKMKLETEKSITIPTKDINDRIQILNDKIKELDNQILMNKDNIDKQSNYYQEFQEDKEQRIIDLKLEKEKNEGLEEEEKAYFDFDKINKILKDNTIFNAIIIGMIVLIILIVFYLFLSNIFTFSKKRKLKIDKINVKYDNILDEIKKTKVKGSIKVKKGSLFSFLDDKK
jgi:hypothetical protein